MANKSTKRNRKLNPSTHQTRLSHVGQPKVARESALTGKGPTIREQMAMLPHYK
jgi:hypothetical protein